MEKQSNCVKGFEWIIGIVCTIYARPSQPRLSTADHASSFVAYSTTAGTEAEN
jgi:hypothetical protein